MLLYKILVQHGGSLLLKVFLLGLINRKGIEMGIESRGILAKGLMYLFIIGTVMFSSTPEKIIARI
jgi:hypothetical protein